MRKLVSRLKEEKNGRAVLKQSVRKWTTFNPSLAQQERKEGKRMDLVTELPEELALLIFAAVDSPTLAACCLVSHNWKRLAGENR